MSGLHAHYARIRAKIRAGIDAERLLENPAPSGFISHDAARVAVRRLKLRRHLGEVRSLVDAALRGLDKVEQAQNDALSARIEAELNLRAGDVKGGVRRHPVDRIERDDMREKELLQGADLVLQFLNTLLGALGHGAFSFNHSDDNNANPAEPGAHRLSDEAPHT